MSGRDYIISAGGLLAVAAAVVAAIGWRHESLRVAELQLQVAELQREESRSAVLRSVSNQMEEIAYQQKRISDEQREEAEQQTRVANELRHRSERERQNAVEAERQAVASEKKAREASVAADRERVIAEQQRTVAEHSKRVADTLSYIALGRSLGSLAATQYAAGNKQTALLLAYASYRYTSRYGGDVYYPAVLQSLMVTSESMHTWTEHSAAVTDVDFLRGKTDQMVSASTYGQLLLHSIDGDRLNSTTLLKDSRYDLRSVYVDAANTIYAMSGTGHIIIYSGGKVQVLDTGISPLVRMVAVADDKLLLAGEGSLALLDTKSRRITGRQAIGYSVVCAGRSNGAAMLFDDKGNMHIVRSLYDMTTERTPVQGRITCYARSENAGLEAYGTADGTIYLRNRSGSTRTLLGHRSRVSKMKFSGSRLYSSSYDGTLNLWLCDREKMEPMPIFNTGTWLTNFTFDNAKKYVWACDYTGQIIKAPVSVQEMVSKVKSRIERDLTVDEWNYYIGKNIPYESFR